MHVGVYRLSGGRLGGRIGRAGVLLLHHTGRRSGISRVAPLPYLADPPRLIVVASKGGAERHPDWYLNLMAAPATSVQLGRNVRRVVARTATPEVRERMWPRLVAIYPGYARYQRHAPRVLPVVVLEPVAE